MRHMSTTKPTVGRVVLYTLAQHDLEYAAGVLPGGNRLVPLGSNNLEWAGNLLRVGDVYAADIVRVWSDSCVNLQVKLDGPGTLWVASRNEGDAEGHWHWPNRT